MMMPSSRNLITFIAAIALGLAAAACNGAAAPRIEARSDDRVSSSMFDSSRAVQDDGDDAQDETTDDSRTEDSDETEDATQRIELELPNDEASEKETFKLEIAATPDTIERGLMGREKIDEHGGMIFIYAQPGYRSFWMKNCIIDIDVIFVDAEGKVVRTYAMEHEPLRYAGETLSRYESRLKRYRSVRPAQFAIELKAGTIERLGIEAGDVIDADWKEIAKHAGDDER